MLYNRGEFMTLIVGAVFPWSDLLKSPGFRAAAQLGIPRSVILAADSRWTYPSGKTEDGAVKLFGVGEPCIVAYAGGAAAGEDAIGALSTKLGRRRTIEEFAVMIREILQEAWRAHPHKEDDLDILFGLSVADGRTWLAHFSAADRFVPHTVDDMMVIAPTAAAQHFRKVLQEGTDELCANASRQAVSLTVETWAAILMATVKETCESRVDPAVGGAITCGYTALGQVRGQGAVRVDFDSGKPRAKELGLHPLEGKTVRKQWEYHPPDESR